MLAITQFVLESAISSEDYLKSTREIFLESIAATLHFSTLADIRVRTFFISIIIRRRDDKMGGY